ncbi:hypothetical protein FRC06_005669 [Ceratobasidium sp. 370]|nr:hypothetical protein FRC06_005669 [Ceratobasidium sp. 370]
MEPPPNPDPNPSANDGKKVCFCCGKQYGPKQLKCHCEIFLAGLQHELGEAGQAAPDGDGNFAMDGVEPRAEPSVEVALAEAVMEEDNPGAAIVPDTDDNAPTTIGVMDLDGRDTEDVPLPGEPLPNELRRNPPVTIQDWPEPGSDNESEADGAAGEQIENGDQEPTFVEQPEQLGDPAQPELDPMHEQDVTDQALRGLMEMQLGDLVDEEWLNLCKSKRFKADVPLSDDMT